jgi:hypothetical protein
LDGEAFVGQAIWELVEELKTQACLLLREGGAQRESERVDCERVYESALVIWGAPARSPRGGGREWLKGLLACRPSGIFLRGVSDSKEMIHPSQPKENFKNKAVGHDFPLPGHRARSIVMHT